MAYDPALAERLRKAAIAREDAYQCPIVEALKSGEDGWGLLVVHMRRMRRRCGWLWPEIGILRNYNGERWTTSTWMGVEDILTRDLGNAFSGEIPWR